MFSNFKKRLGVLTAIAVMAALVPALAASPASAAVALTATAPASGALHSACPAGSAAAGGFTDTTSTDVDCIKMHGITTGVTATTYEPSSNIPRWQMALYLTRFATAAGVTLGSGADQGFTDISGYSAAIQTAINQIKQLGVTTGTTATTYSPDDNVTREQMAMFVERMLAKSTAGIGGSGATATYSGKISSATKTYNYTDIDAGGVTYEGHEAIAEIYHLGIPGHAKTVTTFSPAAAITRADMATWMTNALAHTNARPAGVWVQVTGASANTLFGSTAQTLHISHRDDNRAAVPGTLVDVFSDLTAANTDPFSATTGLCTAANTTELGNAGTECAVDLGDVSTDSKGNVGGTTGVAGGTVTAATTVTYWAHTGAVGTKFNNLTMTANTVSRSQLTAASVLKLTNTIPTNNVMDSTDAAFELVKYGTSVTITGTAMTSATGSVVAGAFGVKVVDTVITVGDDGVAGNLANSNGTDVTTSVTTTTGATSAGVWTHTLTQADPTPVGTALSATTSRTHTTSVISIDLDANGTYETAAGTVSLAWDDNAAGAKSATLTEGSYWGLGLALASGGVSRTATATVYDQYGTGVANHAVVFTGACATGTGDCGESFTDNTSRTTNSVGVATLSYTDVLTATGKETTTATPSGVTAATSTYYRIDGTTPNHTEVDNSSIDGAVVGTTFTLAATTGVATFAANHGLTTGEEVYFVQQPRSAAIGGHITVATGNADAWLTAGDLTGSVAVGEQVLFTTAPNAATNISANVCYWVTELTSTTSIGISATRGGTNISTGANSDANGVLVKCTVPAGPYFFTSTADTTGTFHPTRTTSALGVASYSTKISDAVASATNGGIARVVGRAAVHDSDEMMEVVINDAANNAFIVEQRSKVGDYDYMRYVYDSGDQFNIYGDTVTNADLATTANATAASLATFQTHLAAKMNAVTGVGNAGNQGDIFSISNYVNGNAGGGVSVFSLGS